MKKKVAQFRFLSNITQNTIYGLHEFSSSLLLVFTELSNSYNPICQQNTQHYILNEYVIYSKGD